MKFAQESQDQGYFITAYEEDSVTVNGKMFERSLVICSDRMNEDWDISSIDKLQAPHIESILELEPELIVIGTGKQLVFPAVESYAAIIRQGIGIDFMDTGAACRTYNILMSEGRGIVAGLIL